MAATSFPYADVTNQYAWAKKAIQLLTGDGVISGFGHDTFKPGLPVTRGEYLIDFWKLVSPKKKPVANLQIFSDVRPNNPNFNYVGAAYDLGWIHDAWLYVSPGYAFHANYHLSFSDASSILVAYLLQQSTAFSTLGEAPLVWTKAHGFFQGIPDISTSLYMNRADVAVLLANVKTYLNITHSSTVTQTVYGGKG